MNAFDILTPKIKKNKGGGNGDGYIEAVMSAYDETPALIVEMGTRQLAQELENGKKIRTSFDMDGIEQTVYLYLAAVTRFGNAVSITIMVNMGEGTEVLTANNGANQTVFLLNS